MRGAASVLGALLLVIPATAIAQDDGDDFSDDGVLPEDYADEKPLAEGASARIGVGARLRYVFMPESIIELFLEDAPSGSAHVGFGVELVRRKGDFDIVLGIEYEGIAPEDGMYLESGDTPGIPGENPDLVEFDGFAIFGADVSFIWHKKIASKVDFRYGAGIGVAAVLGDVVQTDTTCPSGTTDIQSQCTPISSPGMGQYKEKNEDVPPAVPLVNVLIGTRIEVAPQLTLNVEAGFRDLFYLGVGTNYLF